MKNKEEGITIISLVVIIIVLLILAGMSIATLNGDNGILTQAEKSKEEIEISEEKEILELILLEHAKSNNKKIEKKLLESSLISYCGENKTEVVEIIENKFLIKFKESSNCYILSDDEISERLKEDEISVIKINCVNSNNEILKSLETFAISGNVEIPQSIITDEGLEYVAENNTVETTANEIDINYILVCKDDKTLVFTPVDDYKYMLGGIKEEYRKLEYMLEIPETYNNKPITQISSFSFSNTKIKAAVLNNNVSQIGGNAFMDCFLLEKVKFGNNYSSMANGASVFNRCIKLNNSSFSLSDNNTAFKIVDGVLYSYDLKKIILFPPGQEGEFKIPNFVNILGLNSFGSSKLTSIYIPENIETWEGGVFYESRIQKINVQSNMLPGLCFWYAPLKEVTIGKNVIEIGGNAFIDHLDLQEINYEGTMEQWNNITKRNDWYNRCTNLTTIVCTDGIITL